jgi:hypothetical protein
MQKKIGNLTFWLSLVVFSGFTSRPTSLLASNIASVFFYGMCVLPHYINIISIGQKLLCPIQFQSFLALLEPVNGIFQNKVQKQWW